MKLLSILFSSLLVMACATGPCPRATAASPEKSKSQEAAVSSSSTAERVKVYKADGSLQCGQGKQIPVAEMQKQLKDIKVHSAVNKNDGMMRIQVCGSPTGNSNVYEIDRKDLEAALKAGFKEWAGE
jgi:hypothetical protein